MLNFASCQPGAANSATTRFGRGERLGATSLALVSSRSVYACRQSHDEGAQERIWERRVPEAP